MQNMYQLNILKISRNSFIFKKYQLQLAQINEINTQLFGIKRSDKVMLLFYCIDEYIPKQSSIFYITHYIAFFTTEATLA